MIDKMVVPKDGQLTLDPDIPGAPTAYAVDGPAFSASSPDGTLGVLKPNPSSSIGDSAILTVSNANGSAQLALVIGAPIFQAVPASLGLSGEIASAAGATLSKKK